MPSPTPQIRHDTPLTLRVPPPPPLQGPPKGPASSRPDLPAAPRGPRKEEAAVCRCSHANRTARGARACRHRDRESNPDTCAHRPPHPRRDSASPGLRWSQEPGRRQPGTGRAKGTCQGDAPTLARVRTDVPPSPRPVRVLQMPARPPHPAWPPPAPSPWPRGPGSPRDQHPPALPSSPRGAAAGGRGCAFLPGALRARRPHSPHPSSRASRRGREVTASPGGADKGLSHRSRRQGGSTGNQQLWGRAPRRHRLYAEPPAPPVPPRRGVSAQPLAGPRAPLPDWLSGDKPGSHWLPRSSLTPPGACLTPTPSNASSRMVPSLLRIPAPLATRTRGEGCSPLHTGSWEGGALGQAPASLSGTTQVCP